MPLTAITRAFSPSINECELSFQTRQPIDVAKAEAQHEAYQACLRGCDVRVISLPAEPALPDSVFVEDAAVVLDEVAVITNPGAASRRAEAKSVANALSAFRPLKFIVEPATLDGGDVLRVGRTIFVGLSQRTNRAGFEQLRESLEPHGYAVQPIDVRGCLHLKSACSALGDDSILIDPASIETERLRGFDLLEVPEEEPSAANVLLVNGTVIMPSSFPKTQRLLEKRGCTVRTVDVSDLQKAEAGVTCCSIIFNDKALPPFR